MQIVIIEPHHHFDVLLALQPSIFKASHPVLIVCSQSCREKVTKANPAFEEKVRWNTETNPTCPHEPSVLFFSSLQYKRSHWLKWIKTWPTAIMIHNANLYARVLPSIPRNESKYQPLRFALEKHIRSVFRNQMTEKIIRFSDVFIPFSSTQATFMCENFDKPVQSLSIIWKQEEGICGDYDFIPIYGRTPDIDWDFFQGLKNTLGDQIICLCHRNEYETCKKMFPSRTEYVFSPIPHLDYVRWFQEAKRIIIPFKKKVSFGLSREILGSTKYLWRIYWALQFDKTLLMPEDIIRPEIPKSSSIQIRQFREIMSFLERRMHAKNSW